MRRSRFSMTGPNQVRSTRSDGFGASPLIKGGKRGVSRIRQRGVILPVVLFVLALIGLLAAMFSFRVFADLSSTQAVALRLQTRLAAEAGVEYVRMVLRTARFDRTVWYNNPDEFNRIIVSAYNRDAQTAGTNQEFEEDMVFRFSIVADDPTDDKDYIRFGITDEASKLNLNTATEDQLLRIVTLALGEDTETNPQLIVDAILDWRDEDGEPRGETGDTESVYYRTLPKPYRVKNAPFDTVEELLLVKGITPAVLYGEDFDRNGLLTENEKDGDQSFPADNQDDVLNRGLYAYLTVLSTENNVSNSNRPRTYLAGPEETVRAELTSVFPDEPGVVDYIVNAAKKPQQQEQGGGGGGGGGRGGQGRSGAGGRQGSQGQGGQGGTGQPGSGQQQIPGGSQGQQGNPGPGGQPGGAAPGQNPKDKTRRQARPGADENQEQQQGQQGDPNAQGGQSGQPQGGDGAGGPLTEPINDITGGEGQEQGGQQGQQGQPGGGDGQEVGEGGEQDENPPLTSPASLMLPRTVDGELVQSPLTLEHLAVLMDRTTTIDPEKRTIPGLININTAPPVVLQCLEGLTSDQIDGILATRDTLDATTLSTTAWLVTEGVLDITTYEKLAPHITARGQQFTIESLGFADHVGMVTRLQVVVDMNGPIAQTVYYRDISNLGGSFPIREEDKDKIRGR